MKHHYNHCCPLSAGLLRSVSRAVDLIMAHFGSSRDPEEKVRIGQAEHLDLLCVCVCVSKWKSAKLDITYTLSLESNKLCQQEIYFIYPPFTQMRLGNSSWSPTIAGLVLEHLCPTIQNILEDGLRDHKLDLIIGQRRNHSWTVVEVSTRIGTYSYKMNE